MASPVLRSNTTDAAIWRDVAQSNEYALGKFASADVILDVGAHIGAFATACLDRGAGTVVCYEPCPLNFEMLRQNVGDRATLHQKAVCGAHTRFTHLTRCGSHYAAQSVLHGTGTPIACVALDDILSELGRVRLLKLDCEGAEWPILFESKRLQQIDEIKMEYHSIAWKCHEMGQPAETVTHYDQMTARSIIAHLASYGFRNTHSACEFVRDDPRHILGHLFFTRHCGEISRF